MTSCTYCTVKNYNFIKTQIDYAILWELDKNSNMNVFECKERISCYTRTNFN